MSSTNFVNGTVVTADWLNDVNDHTYERVIYVKDYGAVGDGVTDDTAAIQAAVDAAEAIVSGMGSIGGHGVQINFSTGSYLITSTITVTDHGISFVGDAGKGTQIRGETTLFDVGDYTNTRRVSNTVFRDLVLFTSSGSNTLAAVKLYRTTSTYFQNVNFFRWYIGVDCYRASTSHFTLCRYNGSGRTTTALAWIRMQGTDETLTTGDTYSPGGGIHITDCELDGRGNTADTEHGILLHSVDGFYMSQCHFVGFNNSVTIEPLGTAANHYIYDVMVTNCYFDEPASSGTSYNLKMVGTVRESITMANGSTQNSSYEGIRFANCLFRGSTYADNNVYIDVTDGDSWFDSSRRLNYITFANNSFKQSKLSNLRIVGGSSNRVEPTNFVVNGNTFIAGNSNANGNIGAALNLNVESGIISNNIFNMPAGNSDYIIFASTLDAGTADNAAPSITIIGNDLSKSEVVDVSSGNPELVRVSQTNNINSNTTRAFNTYAGVGRRVVQDYRLTTTDATTTNIFSYTVPSSLCGSVTADVVGCNADGTKAVAYRFYTGFRNNGTSTTLSSGGSSWTTVNSWNPDAIATIPSADVSGNSLRVRVTGVASETWTWSCSIDLIGAK